MANPSDPYIGRELDGYKILELLGRGGMARVYRALDLKLKRFAAIKIIDPDVRDPKKYQLRFDREARAIAMLKHPNIVSIYRFNEVRSVYYMAMEYVDGADLRWVLKDYRSANEMMDWYTVAQIIREVSSALDYAHENGVIHRDIKPSNIMISRDGTAILTDFGLVLMTSEKTFGEIFGSPHYIAPEQAVNSANAGTQTDLYSLGVVLYEMLTGDVPYNEGSAMEIAMSHMTAELPDPTTRRPDLPEAFRPVIEKALAKEPKDRYQTGREFSKALDDALKDAVKQKPIPTDTVSRPEIRIQERVAPLASVPDEELDKHTVTPDEPPTLPPDIVPGNPPAKAKSEPRRSSGVAGYLVALFTLLLVGTSIVLVIGILRYVDPAQPPAVQPGYDSAYIPSAVSELAQNNAVVSGVIEERDGENTFVVHGLTIVIEDAQLAEMELENAVSGADFEITGYAQESGSGLIFYTVETFEINGRSVLPNE